MNRIIEQFCETCYGSGINGDWTIVEFPNNFRLSNGFHCMHENGFYDGWANFWITIPKKKPLDFKLHFFRGSHAKANKYMLRSYLEDIIHYCLEELLEKENEK